MSIVLTNHALTVDRALLHTARTDSLAAWARQFPCLSQASSYADLINLVHDSAPSCPNTVEGNEVLWSLLCLAEQDIDAARVVLHAMEGLIKTSARRCALRFHSRDDAMSAAVEAMWDTIRHYPTHRRHEATFANLRGDFLKRLCGKWSTLEVEDTDCLFLETDVLEAIAPLEGLSQHDLALEILARAHDSGAITTEETRLLLASYIEGTADAELAEQLSLSPAALRQRKSRATRHLVAWTQQNS